MDRIRNDLLQEELYAEVLESGLTAYVLPKRGYQKKFATFATRYGSVDRRFVPPGGTEVEVPDGIAHFLEHKLFEDEEKSVMDRFAELGASCNAFTNYTSTTYLFSTTERYEECLALLLDFVQSPYLTEENVEKEKGIIEQELRMYMDDPRWRVFHNLMQAVFHVHPVRVDIGGTVESIREITVAQLELCYRTFYHPSNMTFFAVGDIDPERTFALVRERIRGERRGPIVRILPEEPPHVRERLVVEEMPVALPLFELGFKEQRTGAQGFLEREVVTGVLLDVLFSKSSPLYQRLYDLGLINDRFSASYFAEPDFGVSIVGGESADPERLLDEILAGIREARREGLDEAAVDRVRRRAIGEFLGLFNSPEAIATSFNAAHFKGYDLFDYLRALLEVRPEAVHRRLEEHLGEDNWVASIVRGVRAPGRP